MWKTKVTTRWVLSYLLILILPVLLGGIIYWNSITTLQKQAEVIQDNSVRQAANVLDSMYRSVQNISKTFFADKQIQVLSLAQEVEGRSLEIVPKVQELLQRTRAINTEFASIYLYFPRNRYTIGDAFIIRDGATELSYTINVQMGKDTYKKLLQSGSQNGFHILDDGKLIYSVAKGTGGDWREKEGILLFLIDETALREQFQLDNMYFCLMNEEGQIYELSIPEYEQGIDTGVFRDTEWRNHWNGFEYLVRQKIDGTNLYLCGVISSSTAMEQMRQAMIILLVYVIVCLVIGAVLACWLAKRNYRPVGNLLDMMKRYSSQGSGEAESNTGNEFEVLGSSIRKLLDEFEENRSFAREYFTHRQNQAFQRLLKQEYRDGVLGEQESIRLVERFCSNQYVLLEFDVQDAGEEKSDFLEMGKEDRELLFFILQNVTSELLDESYLYLSGESDGYYFFLLDAVRKDSSMGREERSRQIREIVEHVTGYLYEYYSLRIWVNISQIHEGLKGVHQCYSEVIQINDFRDYVGSKEGILSYEQLGENEEVYEYLETIQLERIVREKLKEHQMEEIYHLLRERYLEEKEPKLKEEDLVSSAERSVYDEMIEEICVYIQEHYYDPQMTVNALAEQYHTSASALSKLFYRKVGSRMLEYISAIRMEKAKVLLASGMSVKDTAEAVGYYNIRPLVRLFKASEGMTPSEYAKIK